MHVIVPFAAKDPKTRLASVLDPEDRAAFANAMLEDVCTVLERSGLDPTVLATAQVSCAAPVEIDERPLSQAVNGVLAETDDHVAIVMADLPLATQQAIERLFEADGDVVIAPGRGGGTNALVVRRPEFRVDYHGLSFRDHVEAAHSVGASVEVVDSHRLSTDVDEPADLLEVAIHAEGRTADWLEAAGFEVRIDDGRPSLER